MYKTVALPKAIKRTCAACLINDKVAHSFVNNGDICLARKYRAQCVPSLFASFQSDANESSGHGFCAVHRETQCQDHECGRRHGGR